VSNYPAAPRDVNLRAMQTLSVEFQVPVGYSDHTAGLEVLLAAVALGACIIEKHLTLDRHLSGPDHSVSLEPHEFSEGVRGIRLVESSLGTGRKEPTASETNIATVVRKSLVAAHDIPAGTVLTPELVAIKRPGTGLPPTAMQQVIGCRVRKYLKAGTLLRLDDLQ
jgi:N,N'-diacetyllegionaminate synthase